LVRTSIRKEKNILLFMSVLSLREKACLHISQLCSTFSITASSPEELITLKEELLLLIDTVSDDAFGLKVCLNAIPATFVIHPFR
jgi:hypothetical protein